MKYTIDSHFNVIPAIGMDGFRSLKSDWDRLAMNNGSYFPFLCHDWYEIWLRHFPDTDLFIPVLYRDDAIVAIMPLMRQIVTKKGIRLKTFEFIGNAYAQARTILFDSVDATERTQFAEKLFQYFMKSGLDWDYLDLYGLQTENGNSEQIANAATRCKFKYRVEHAYLNRFQDGISVSAEEYLSGRTKVVSKNAPYYLRRLQKEGGVEFRVVTDDSDMDAVMDSYYKLYAKSWKKSEGLSPTYHRDLAKLAAAKGWLRLGFLDFNGSPVVCHFWLQFKDTAIWVKSCYDASFKRYSPGTILTYEMFRILIDQYRVNSVDLLQGDQEYKRDWVDGIRNRERLLVFSNTFKGRVASTYLTSIRPRLSKLFKANNET